LFNQSLAQYLFYNKMIKIFLKYLLFLSCLISVLLITDCKKVPWYGISDDIKNSFSFQKGSYWIYKNDSTGLLDSTFVSSFTHAYHDNTVEGLTREVVVMHYNSIFLYLTWITYFPCSGPDYYQVSSILNPDPGQPEGSGLVAYDPNWPANTKIIPGCFNGGIFFYKTMSLDTINNVSYKNVIYSELRSIDSSLNNPDLLIRKIYLAKNIGIIKYYELDHYNKINKSYSLVRYKVIQ